MPTLLGLTAAVLLSLATFGAAFAGCAGANAVPAGGIEASADTSRPGLQADAGPPAAPRAEAPRRVSPPLPPGFVHLADVTLEIAQEMRYFGTYNFVGERIRGYNAPTCILTTQAAEALSQVDQDLARQGYGLKVYDCYRPQMAVNHFVEWARSGQTTMKQGFYPTEPTETLFRRGYIATRSGHTRGSTVDLTMVRRPAIAHVRTTDDYPDLAVDSLQRCDRDRPERFDDGDVDMGTAFDCLSPRAATDVRGIPAEARHNRDVLRAAMRRRGFVNYSKEWWHYTLAPEPSREYHTFPVE